MVAEQLELGLSLIDQKNHPNKCQNGSSQPLNSYNRK